jgi:hypothetical protein
MVCYWILKVGGKMTNDCYGLIRDFYKTTCDICGKEIIGVENFINAGDKVVCSEECK